MRFNFNLINPKIQIGNCEVHLFEYQRLVLTAYQRYVNKSNN